MLLMCDKKQSGECTGERTGSGVFCNHCIPHEPKWLGVNLPKYSIPSPCTLSFKNFKESQCIEVGVSDEYL